jgi:hypothetical protein
LLNKLQGSTTSPPSGGNISNKTIGQQEIVKIKSDLLQITSLPPQARGYAFESFLKGLFDAFGLAAHDPFKLRGEQIDGSFQLGGEIYLLEAKWHSQPIIPHHCIYNSTKYVKISEIKKAMQSHGAVEGGGDE